jgi:hypothetical protein
MKRNDMRTTPLTLAATITLATLVAVPGAPSTALSQQIEQFDVVGPIGSSDDFGDDVIVLENGNYVVEDSGFDSPTALDVGAVHLYDGRTDQLISSLTGSTAEDFVGTDGIEEIDGGRFAVFSPSWNHPDGTVNVGAVTVVDSTTGLNGVVSPDSSLHGSSAFDRVGDRRDEALVGGGFVVLSSSWDHPDGTVNVGAATLVDGSEPLTGPVTPANSLHGTSAGDGVGTDVRALANGDYVVASRAWNHPDGTENVGAATQADGIVGITGPVTVTNSLHGLQANDLVGRGLFALGNGNFVVTSQSWNHPDGTPDVGAVTWVDGSAGLTGPVTVANSLHGSTTGDQIGISSFSTGNSVVETLANGNYVVPSRLWDDPDGAADVGAATWVDGSVGLAGPVTVDNSLHGTAPQDSVGRQIFALTNGNYIVGSAIWNHPDGTIDVGAATWADGSSGITGPVTTDNSLIGTSTDDDIGSRVTPLTTGNFVVRSPDWDHPDGTIDVGAATWADGTVGVAGPITVDNSLHGTTAGDQVGGFELAALTNGDYVVGSENWSDPDGAANVGAVTWADGTVGITGPVTVDNSLHGTTAGDEVGDEVSALADGNYVVLSRFWSHPDGATDVGAVTWGDGGVGISGPVTVDNSVHGSTAGDQVGRGRVRSFDGGSYAFDSEDWDDPDGPFVNAGAVTLGLPDGVTTGPVSRQNSAIGTAPGDIESPQSRLSSGDGIVVETEQQRVIIMRLDRAPFFVGDAPDVAAVTEPGENDAIVTFDTPTAQDARSGVSVACEPASGSVFPVGATEVACTAADAGGQTSSTTFTVTVTATLPGPTGPGPTPPGPTPPGPDAPQPVAPETAVDVIAVTPKRILETRVGDAFTTGDGRFEGGGRLPAGREIEVQVAGRGGVPADATAAFLNVTAIDPDGVGFVTVHPCAKRPNASNVNYEVGDTAPNAVLAKLSPAGTVCIFSVASTDLVVDTAGFVPANGPTTAVEPRRLLDSRPGFDTDDGRFAETGRLGSGEFVEVQVAGRGGVPADSTAAFLNVTAVGPDGAGFLTVFSCTAVRPNASNVNYEAGDTAPNAVLAKLSPAGTVCIFTPTSTDLVVDVNGFALRGSSMTPVDPERILETRDGFVTADALFQNVGRVEAGTEIEVQVAGRGGVPAGATAAFLNVTAVGPDRVGFVTVHPCGKRPNSSNVNYEVGDTAPNAVLAKLSSTGTVCIFTVASTDLVVDTAGFTSS